MNKIANKRCDRILKICPQDSCPILIQSNTNQGTARKELCRWNYGYLSADLEKAMAPHSSTLAWKIPWTEESGGLQSMGSRRVGHN